MNKLLLLVMIVSLDSCIYYNKVSNRNTTIYNCEKENAIKLASEHYSNEISFSYDYSLLEDEKFYYIQIYPKTEEQVLGGCVDYKISKKKCKIKKIVYRGSE